MSEDHLSFDKPAFVRKHLNTNDDIVNVRFNVEERAELQRLKSLLQFDADGTALKTALSISLNVLDKTFGEPLLRYICSQRRIRPK